MALKITVVNNTYISPDQSEVLSLGFYGVDKHPLTQWVVSNPEATLSKMGSMSVYEIDEHIKDLVTGESFIFLSYTVGTDFWFGIQIVFPFEFLHAGYGPYYQVAAAPVQPEDASYIQWIDPTNDTPAQKTLMNTSNFHLPDWLSIDIDPTVPDGQSLELLVSVKGKKPI